VAIGTKVKGNADILRFAIGSVGVALLALHLCMQSGQRVTGFAVIELGDVEVLPVHEIVTRLAVRTQAAFMKVLVAGNAGG